MPAVTTLADRHGGAVSFARLLFAGGVLFASGWLPAACGSGGSVAVTWHLDGEPDELSPETCALHGIDGVRLSLRPLGGQQVAYEIYPCFDGGGEIGAAPGSYLLLVEGLGLRGQGFRDPTSGAPAVRAETQVTVVAGDATPVAVTLVPNPECSDGADNDRDGYVDLYDADCQAPTGTSEGPRQP
jgi:hypothetical protein